MIWQLVSFGKNASYTDSRFFSLLAMQGILVQLLPRAYALQGVVLQHSYDASYTQSGTIEGGRLVMVAASDTAVTCIVGRTVPVGPFECRCSFSHGHS